MNNHKSKVWTISAAIIFGLVALATAGLLVKVAGLNMLPMKYMGLAISVVVFLLLLILAFFFLLPIKKKVEEQATEEQPVKKPVAKYVLRSIAMILAIAMVVVDVVGIQMVNKFEETLANLREEEQQEEKESEIVKIEEFVFGVFVLADDKAENLDDVKRYDLGYSLAYDRNNTKMAINVIENELDRKLKFEEFRDIFEMVDMTLSGEKDGFLLSTDYLDIIADQEGYEDIADKIRCVYECTVTIETDVAEKEEVPFDITKDTFIVYLSGHDTTFATKRANSDVNILAVVNPTTKQVLLINSPRDSYVEISVSPDGALDKLTHCGTYGVECSMETLGELYDIDVNYYAQLNFVGFTRLVDALGGITVYSEKEFVSTSEGILIPKGYSHLDGAAALEFVRERKQFSGGDRMRGQHQMAVIKGIIGQMSSGNLLRNYDDILDSMGKYFKWNFSQEDISALVKMQLGDMAEWNVQMYAINGTGDKKTSYSLPNLSTYVMIIDPATVDHAKTLIDMVYDGEIIEDEDLVLPEKTENNE